MISQGLIPNFLQKIFYMLNLISSKNIYTLLFLFCFFISVTFTVRIVALHVVTVHAVAVVVAVAVVTCNSNQRNQLCHDPHYRF